jgi:tetratricopeptide (TPR) repeat protein
MSLKKVFIYLLTLIYIAQADLTKAYGYYLIGEFDSALVHYYDVLKTDSNSIDAIYGLINCNIAEKKFDKAFSIAKDAANKYQDVILNTKLAYLYSRRNRNKEVSSLYTSTLDLLFKDSVNTAETKNQLHSDYIIATGYGFLEGEKFKKALYWFHRGDSLFTGQESFKSAIELTKTSSENAQALSVSFNSGFIEYSKNAIYKYGNFLGVSTGFLVQNHNYFKLLFNRTKINYNDLKYGIVYDTLLAKNSEYPDPENDKLLSSRIYTDLNGKRDTAFYTYREFYLSKDGGVTGYDFTTTLRPEALTENDFLISFTNYRQIVPSTNFNIGYRYTNSNIVNSKFVSTLFFKHETFLDSLNAGIHYFLTLADKNILFQVSPSVGYTFKKLKCNGRINLIKSDKYDVARGIPEKLQISSDIDVHINLKKITLSSGVFFGDRVFLNSADGEVLYNVLAPTKFGTKDIIEWVPLKNLTIFYLFVFTKYDNLSYDKVIYPEYWSMIHMGGIYFQW